MARPRSDQPTDGELEILQLLWDLGPAPLGALCEALRQRRPVATTTVSTMLRIMLDKGLVERSQQARGALWSAARSREDTSRGLVSRLLDRAFGGSARQLVTHLIEDGELSEAERQEILRLLAERDGAADDEPELPS